MSSSARPGVCGCKPAGLYRGGWCVNGCSRTLRLGSGSMPMGSGNNACVRACADACISSAAASCINREARLRGGGGASGGGANGVATGRGYSAGARNGVEKSMDGSTRMGCGGGSSTGGCHARGRGGSDTTCSGTGAGSICTGGCGCAWASYASCASVMICSSAALMRRFIASSLVRKIACSARLCAPAYGYDAAAAAAGGAYTGMGTGAGAGAGAAEGGAGAAAGCRGGRGSVARRAWGSCAVRAGGGGVVRRDAASGFGETSAEVRRSRVFALDDAVEARMFSGSQDGRGGDMHLS